MKKIDWDRIERDALDEIAVNIPPWHGIPFKDWEDFRKRDKMQSKLTYIEGAVAVTLRHVRAALREIS
jgi:NAD-dependent dihydropyrimidine dehydrogenase PreA subunit